MRSVYLRLSITDRCDLRCRYCRPLAAAPQQAPLDDGQLLALLRELHQVASLGKVRLTGGEPLTHPRVVSLTAGLRRLLPTTQLCLTTNGTRLARLAAPLRSAGLDRINVSVDTLDERRYRALTGGRLDRVLAGLTAAARAGPRPLKLNTVLQRTVNGDQLRQLVELAADLDAEARFIELMPLGSAGRDHYHRQFLSAGEALARLREELRYEGPLPREADGATARRHRFRTPAGAAVTVGLIAPVSAPFCASCDRLRLDCRGRLHTCIRARHAVELAPLLTRRGELRAALRRALAAKAPADCWPDRNMLALGG